MKNTTKGLFVIFLVLGNLVAFAQNITIQGVITAEDDGSPLPGANVIVKGMSIGASANFDGEYTLEVPGQDVTLIFSYQGFSSQEVVVGAQRSINIALKADVNELDEVVIIGYGSTTKKDLTGSIATIKSEDLEAVRSTTADDFVQGRVSGVLLTQTSGQPGGATSVRIRGSSSINASNEPLYVIDGFPVDNNSDNLSAGVAEGPSINALSTLSANDIASIDVLKDASATAIYGSRGANGVIIITTKRGLNGEAQINYDTYVGVSEVIQKLEVLDGSQFAFYVNESRYNGSGEPRFYTDPNSFGAGTDWQDEIFRTAITKSHDLSIKGGNQDIKYAISGSYLDQEGVVIETDFKRYNFRVNLDFKATEKLSIENSLSLNRTNFNTARTETTGGTEVASSAITGAYQFNPLLPVFDPEGNYTKGNFIVQNDGTFVNDVNNIQEQIPNFPSPVAYQNLSESQGKATRVLDNLAIKWDFAKNFQLKTTLGVDMNISEQFYFRTEEIDFGNTPGAFAAQAKNTATSYLAETTVTYTNTFSNKHRLNALMGASWQDFSIETLSGNALGFPTENFGSDNLGLGLNPGVSSNVIESRLISYFGRVNYILDNKYIFTVTSRIDGSSKFGDGNKYGFFPSGAFAWNVSEEEFLQDSGLYLKLRLGYGIIGNESIAPYSAQSTFKPTYHSFNDNEVVGQLPSTPANSALKWERTEQYNLGLDLGFFNDRLGLTVDGYQKNTEDLLLNLQVPSQTGYIQSVVNAGSVRNQGVELGINAQLFKGGFNWDVNLTGAYNKNKILDLAGLDNIPTGFGILGINNWQLLEEGGEIGAFYGYVSDGIIQLDDDPTTTPTFATDAFTPGERKYKDLNGDGVIDADNDRTFIGNPIPEYTFGINNTVTWKNWDLNIFMQGVYGNEIANFNRINLENLNGQGNVLLEAFSNRWTPQNPGNTYTRAADGPRNIVFSDNYVEDGSYLRLKSATLGYSIPSNFLSKMKINKLRLYFTGKNLFTITNYSGVDPEVSFGGQNNNLSAGADIGGYPTSRTYLLGLNVNF
ncbi:MAG: TonB-dependent receptor [Algicola sp.]|nr:TonB-dependent receptor [Algicola sp.]